MRLATGNRGASGDQTMDDQPFYYRLRGRTIGPLGLRQIRQRAQQAQIGPNTDVSRDGLQWGKASDFPEIFGASASEPPPTSTGSFSADDFSGVGPTFGGGTPTPTTGGQRWYYTANGAQQGPVEMATLQQMVASGSLAATEHVIPEGGSQWMTVSSVPQLAGGGGAFGTDGPVINTGGSGGRGSAERSSRRSKSSGLAITSLVLGIVGLLLWLCPLIGLPVTVLGIIFGSVGINSAGRGMAIAGLVMSIIGLILTIINAFFGFVMAIT